MTDESVAGDNADMANHYNKNESVTVQSEAANLIQQQQRTNFMLFHQQQRNLFEQFVLPAAAAAATAAASAAIRLQLTAMAQHQSQQHRKQNNNGIKPSTVGDPSDQQVEIRKRRRRRPRKRQRRRRQPRDGPRTIESHVVPTATVGDQSEAQAPSLTA